MIARKVITRRFDKEILDVFGYMPEFIFKMETDSNCEKDFSLKLAEVMIRAILASNPVLCNSQRLTAMIRELIFRGANEKIAKDILDFYANNNEADSTHEIMELDIDGFICFRLREYSEQIDAVLYRVVRDRLRKGETV